MSPRDKFASYNANPSIFNALAGHYQIKVSINLIQNKLAIYASVFICHGYATGISI